MTISVWAIYDHPKDYPDQYVARRWVVPRESGDPVPTEEVVMSTDIEVIRFAMRSRGLHLLPRFENDDGAIMETWL